MHWLSSESFLASLKLLLLAYSQGGTLASSLPCTCAFLERKSQVLINQLSSHAESLQLRGTDWHQIVFLGTVVNRGSFSAFLPPQASQCQSMHISTKDLVYEHLPHSTLFTLSPFPIFPYIAYLAILDTKVCIHTICRRCLGSGTSAAL